MRPRILPVIVISQFCCASMWFASNGVMNDLILEYNLKPSSLGHLTSAVQFGFITGTLVFALLTLVDRFSPSKVFMASAVMGALMNLGMIWSHNTLVSLLSFRFMTGFFLAGIYPVGMKIAADYYKEGLGKSLGYLVGALVVGTAFPHLVRDYTEGSAWKSVVALTSGISVVGGVLMMLFVPDGPYRQSGQRFDITVFWKVFRSRKFRSAAFGYFGHMWELYAFWAFIPFFLINYEQLHSDTVFNKPVISFLVIGLGGLSCIVGGYLSLKYGPKRMAALFLSLSGLCCLISPLLFQQGSSLLFICFLLFWGLVVVADSPLFSTLVANNATPETKGTGLTIVNCIGFSITIVSLQLLSLLVIHLNPSLIYLVLAVGPLLGLWGLYEKTNNVVAV